MVVSLLAYFVSMVSAFALLICVWIGLIGASPFQRVHVLSYPSPIAAQSDQQQDPVEATLMGNKPQPDPPKNKVQVANSDSAAYCAARFRSYNPATGTYLGFDGVTHSCP